MDLLRFSEDSGHFWPPDSTLFRTDSSNRARILGDSPIRCDKRQSLELRLCDKKSVERVLVNRWKSTSCYSMIACYDQFCVIIFQQISA